MADAVTAVKQFGGSRVAIFSFTNVSDGTGESGVQKIDISALPGAPTAVRITRVWYSIYGGSVRVLFDHDTDDTVLVLGGSGHLDFRCFGGIPDPASTGGTGDIRFTTVGTVANDTYTIVMEVSY